MTPRPSLRLGCLGNWLTAASWGSMPKRALPLQRRISVDVVVFFVVMVGLLPLGLQPERGRQGLRLGDSGVVDLPQRRVHGSEEPGPDERHRRQCVVPYLVPLTGV